MAAVSCSVWLLEQSRSPLWLIPLRPWPTRLLLRQGEAATPQAHLRPSHRSGGPSQANPPLMREKLRV